MSDQGNTGGTVGYVTHKQLAVSLSIVWLYILVLTLSYMTQNPGWVGIMVFVGAIAGYAIQLITLHEINKRIQKKYGKSSSS